MKILENNRIARFIVVGLANTIVGFTLLNLAYYKLGLSKIVASIFATSLTLVISFILNRGFVFEDRSKNTGRQIISFIMVTALGTILFLNIIYAVSLKLFSGHESFIINTTYRISKIKLSPSFVDINASTAIMTGVAMFWNYNGYKLFVFNRERSNQEGAIKDGA